MPNMNLKVIRTILAVLSFRVRNKDFKIKTDFIKAKELIMKPVFLECYLDNQIINLILSQNLL